MYWFFLRVVESPTSQEDDDTPTRYAAVELSSGLSNDSLNNSFDHSSFDEMDMTQDEEDEFMKGQIIHQDTPFPGEMKQLVHRVMSGNMKNETMIRVIDAISLLISQISAEGGISHQLP